MNAHFTRYEDLSQPANSAEHVVAGGVHFAEYLAAGALGVLAFVGMVVAVAVPLIIFVSLIVTW
jgi:hypothetical protein